MQYEPGTVKGQAQTGKTESQIHLCLNLKMTVRLPFKWKCQNIPRTGLSIPAISSRAARAPGSQVTGDITAPGMPSERRAGSGRTERKGRRRVEMAMRLALNSVVITEAGNLEELKVMMLRT